MKRGLSLLLLLVAPVAQGGKSYYAGSNDMYVWNGTSLMPLYNTIGMSCDHWTMWYFRAGELQTPGTQWGSASGPSSDDVLKQWEESKKTDEGWKEEWTKYHMTWKPSTQTYDNALGPICVTKAAFDSTPEVAQKLDELTQVAQQAASIIKDVRESVNLSNALTTPRGDTPSIYDKTSIEEFLNNLADTPQKVFSTRKMLMNQISPDMVFISGQLDAFNQMLSAARARQALLAKRYPAPPKLLTQNPEAWVIFENKENEKPTKCRVPHPDHVISKSDGHMDHRTGGQVGWYTDTDWICESGLHYTEHCGDELPQTGPAHRQCEERGRPSN
jgi:hypothetical protein